MPSSVNATRLANNLQKAGDKTLGMLPTTGSLGRQQTTRWKTGQVTGASGADNRACHPPAHPVDGHCGRAHRECEYGAVLFADISRGCTRERALPACVYFFLIADAGDLCGRMLSPSPPVPPPRARHETRRACRQGIMLYLRAWPIRAWSIYGVVSYLWWLGRGGLLVLARAWSIHGGSGVVSPRPAVQVLALHSYDPPGGNATSMCALLNARSPSRRLLLQPARRSR
eukprot:scaffold4161_cov101-Isochrysis_galbana.AAC.12